MRRTSILLSLTFVLAIVMAAGCSSRKVDIQKTLKVTEVTTGWFDAGVQPDGKNKLIPTISFKVQNTDTEPLSSVQVLAKFNVIGDAEELGSAFVKVIGADALPSGKSTQPFVMQAIHGYTGEQPRMAMLQHTAFRDAQVELYGKYKSDSFVKLGVYRITRQLLTR